MGSNGGRIVGRPGYIYSALPPETAQVVVDTCISVCAWVPGMGSPA
jgi:hypothetical protein